MYLYLLLQSTNPNDPISTNWCYPSGEKITVYKVTIEGKICFSPGVPFPEFYEKSTGASKKFPETEYMETYVKSTADFLSDLSKHGYRVVSSSSGKSGDIVWTLEKEA